MVPVAVIFRSNCSRCRYEQRLNYVKERVLNFKTQSKAIKKETAKLRKDVGKEVKKLRKEGKVFRKTSKRASAGSFLFK